MKKICYTLLLSIHAGYARITATIDLSQVTAPAPRQVYEYMRVAKKLPPADSLESLSDNQNRMALVSNKLNAPGKLDFTTTIYPIHPIVCLM